MRQLDLFDKPAEPSLPPSIPLDSETEFQFGKRALRISRVLGDDDAAPVIVEELTNRFTLKGQYALWSRQGVMRELEKR